MPKASKTADAFARAVEVALERSADATWLGERSPLAAPYFLGAALDEADALSFSGCGLALRRVLQTAAQTLDPKAREILDASFFKRKLTLNNAGIALSLNKSEATYYRNRVAAIDALARAVMARIAPPLRAEAPVAAEMIGREGILAEVLDALNGGGSVSLTGAGGLGKTTLAVAVAGRWPGGPPNVFWHTIRPGLNDQAASLIFALGYFLRGLGAPNTWRQVVADGGSTPAARALGRSATIWVCSRPARRCSSSTRPICSAMRPSRTPRPCACSKTCAEWRKWRQSASGWSWRPQNTSPDRAG